MSNLAIAATLQVPSLEWSWHAGIDFLTGQILHGKKRHHRLAAIMQESTKTRQAKIMTPTSARVEGWASA
jgi:hypothetical protein